MNDEKSNIFKDNLAGFKMMTGLKFNNKEKGWTVYIDEIGLTDNGNLYIKGQCKGFNENQADLIEFTNFMDLNKHGN